MTTILGWLTVSLVAFLGAVFLGKRNQSLKNKNQQLEHVVKTMKETEEIENEVQQRSDAQLLDRISK